MCGIAGFLDLHPGPSTGVADAAVDAARARVLDAMTGALVHRGPDDEGRFLGEGVALGFRRLSIVGLSDGTQPIPNEDGTVVLVCNGEIFNHRELRAELEAKGHRFRTSTDVEVLVHLYEEHGTALLDRVNGQFAFAVHDSRRRRLFLARDHTGILPLYYARSAERFVFGSEIKAVLEHPEVERRVDLTGLDQVLTFPGPVAPRTLFHGVSSLENGHLLVVENGTVRKEKYWDLEYPVQGEGPAERPDAYYVERLRELLAQSVRRRMQADVPVGFYLSGGLDSSLIGALVREQDPQGTPDSFSIAFADRGIDESRYQRLMAERLGSRHHEIAFDPADIAADLERAVWHGECPVKETYNTCSLALSAAVRASGSRVVLTGEGADELFGGYLGYRFDQGGRRQAPTDPFEADVRTRLWGDPEVFYERDYHAWRESKLDLWAPDIRDSFAEVDCLNHPVADPALLRGRHPLHQRSYLDVKLRLSDHLLSDHGDRMALANSVEARYPFLDRDVVEFATTVPPRLMVAQGTEKYVLKQAASGLLPEEIIRREKFGFRAQGSPELLRKGLDWVEDLLSYDRIKRQGYFDPDVVEHLKQQYRQDGYQVHPHLGDDLLLTVLTFGLLLDRFQLPDHA